MFSYFTCRRAGNAIVGVDFDWIGTCNYPDECNIHFVLWKLVQVGTELKRVKAGDDDIVSLTGLTLLSSPHNASGSFSTYLDENCLYCIALYVNTKASSEAYMSPASVADFGSNCN
jgi:hypothetical protein